MCKFSITNLLSASEQHFDNHSQKSQREEELYFLRTLWNRFPLCACVRASVCVFVYFLIPEKVKQPKQAINPMCECFSK